MALLLLAAACTNDPSGAVAEEDAAADVKDATNEVKDAAADVATQTDARSEPQPDVPRSYAPTYSAVWLELLHPSCGATYCHSGANYPTMITPDQAYPLLVGARSRGVECKSTELVLVDPGHPESSLLYLKLLNEPPCGGRMPFMLGALDPRDIEQVRKWIELGAHQD